MSEAIRDQNHVTVALGQDNSNALNTLPFLIDHVTGRVLVDASGGTGQVLTPTGTVNGSNATFTVPAGTVITSIVVDGLERYSGFGYTYVSGTGTITVDPLAPPTEYIRVNTASVSSVGQVQSIVAGANISVNNADPANPIINSTASGGFTLLPATGTINGSNTTFTFTQQPTYIVSDGAWYRVNVGWTFAGLTATMIIPPNDDIWGFV